MNPKNTTSTSNDLADFAAEVFASLPRTDQRTTSGYYLQGLMLEGRRKSMQPMAQRLGIDHQRLQQFVTTSPDAFGYLVPVFCVSDTPESQYHFTPFGQLTY